MSIKSATLTVFLYVSLGATAAPAVAETDNVSAAALDVRTIGKAEVVVSADSMHCESRRWDVPDLPPTAFRRPDGSVVLMAANTNNFELVGKSLSGVSRLSCNQLLRSAEDADPAQFQDSEWLAGLYSFDGTSVYGVVHDEFHGERHNFPGCTVPKSFSARNNRVCWYASSTIVVSKDGGVTFKRLPVNERLLFAPPDKFAPNKERVGAFAPKIVGSPDGNVAYVLFNFVDRNRGIKVQQCLVRLKPDSKTGTLDKTIWNGTRFEPYDANAYESSSTHDCSAVVRGNITSVKYIRSKRLYIGLDVTKNRVSFRTSPDLIRWSTPTTIEAITRFSTWSPDSPHPPTWYYSLIDPDSPSRNFDTIGTRPYLYFVQFHTKDGHADNRVRDIMRLPLSIE